jgi:DNA-directed RNA polymerase specialized sigma24 family protein
MTWLKNNRPTELVESLDEEIHGAPGEVAEPSGAGATQRWLHAAAAIERLPGEYREGPILSEMEDFSYQEIGLCWKIPIGTVMSRLARAGKNSKRS